MDIKNNIIKLKQDLNSICAECGRNPHEIEIIAVSKTKPVEMIKQAYEAGINNFGENYIQEAIEKAGVLSEYKYINWHFIGNLQSNKVKYLTQFCTMFHSLDRFSLAEALHKRLEQENKSMDVLIQVNTSGEKTKSGVAIENALELAKQVSTLNRLRIRGLMTIAENSEDENAIRKNYRDLKKLFDELKSLDLPHSEIHYLSMGMSGDYKIAIEEGATMIRIGSNIFGAREYKNKNEDAPAQTEHKKTVKLNRVEIFIIKHTPQKVKDILNKLIDRMPPRMGNWVRNNRFLSICIVYSIRGLFFRPSMWAVYGAIAAYFGLKH